MYIDINTLFTFEVSKSDDQSILAAIVRGERYNRTKTMFNQIALPSTFFNSIPLTHLLGVIHTWSYCHFVPERQQFQAS
jgi:hypothetical protein